VTCPTATSELSGTFSVLLVSSPYSVRFSFDNLFHRFDPPRIGTQMAQSTQAAEVFLLTLSYSVFLRQAVGLSPNVGPLGHLGPSRCMITVQHGCLRTCGVTCSFPQRRSADMSSPPHATFQLASKCTMCSRHLAHIVARLFNCCHVPTYPCFYASKEPAAVRGTTMRRYAWSSSAHRLQFDEALEISYCDIEAVPLSDSA
jgi:hypothetical protein